jgi:predicted nucleic acid-binding protein
MRRVSILVDTNVLLRYANANDPAHAIVVAAIRSLRASADEPQIIPQVLYEFWAVATRPLANNGLGLSVVECNRVVAGIEASFRLLNDKPLLFEEWRQLVADCDCKGKISHDARLVAAMRTHGLTQLLTFNSGDFARFPGLVIHDPATIAAAGQKAQSGDS